MLPSGDVTYTHQRQAHIFLLHYLIPCLFNWLAANTCP